MNPTFTIAIPVYERLFGFAEALQSACAVAGCTEILVADNHSTHNKFKMICEAQEDSRIRYVRHDKNYGIYGNENKCAELAIGTFMAILGSDDIIAPDIYDRFLKAYEAMPDLDIFFGPYTTFTESIARPVVERPFPDGPVSSRHFLEDAVAQGMRFHVLFVVRREKVLHYPFVTDPHSSNDLLWIYSNASHLKLYADSKPLSYWRVHPGQDSTIFVSTMYDVFPFLYVQIGQQLQEMKSPKAKEAYRRAERVILSLLLNDRIKEGYWRKRLTSTEVKTSPFLAKAKELIDRNWFLHRLLSAEVTWPVYYNVGRTYRKIKPLRGM